PVGGKTAVTERDVRAVDRLVDEQPIAHEKRRYHAAGWNAVRLDQQSAEDEKDRQRADERLELLLQRAEPWLVRTAARLSSATGVRLHRLHERRLWCVLPRGGRFATALATASASPSRRALSAATR